MRASIDEMAAECGGGVIFALLIAGATGQFYKRLVFENVSGAPLEDQVVTYGIQSYSVSHVRKGFEFVLNFPFLSDGGVNVSFTIDGERVEKDLSEYMTVMVFFRCEAQAHRTEIVGDCKVY